LPEERYILVTNDESHRIILIIEFEKEKMKRSRRSLKPQKEQNKQKGFKWIAQIIFTTAIIIAKELRCPVDDIYCTCKCD
jgi:hypothetical protein